MPNVKPILFSGPMNRALLDGRKTQTRRVLKPQPPDGHRFVGIYGPGLTAVFEPLSRADDYTVRLPYMPGDLLWVREPWRTETFEHDKIAPAKLSGHEKIIYEADADWSLNKSVGRLRPAMYMPRWASRLTLEVTSVKVERLQEISEEDAIAEGIFTRLVECADGQERNLWFGVDQAGHEHSNGSSGPILAFADLWDSINNPRGLCADDAPRGWQANPWIIATTFVVHQMNIDEFLAQREAA